MRFLAQIIKAFRKNVRIMRTATPLEWSPCQFIFLDGFLKKGVSEVPSRFKNKRQVIKKIACSALIGVSIILTLAVLGGTQPDIKRFFHLTSNSVYAADDQPANPQRPRATITGQDAVYTLGEFFTPESHARLFKQATEPGGLSIPFADKRIWAVLPEKLKQATRSMGLQERYARFDTILAKTPVDLTFDSKFGVATGKGTAQTQYGDAVIAGASDPKNGRDAMGALVFIDRDADGISKVIATSGKGNDNEPIAPHFGNRFYGSYEYVQMRDHQSINLSYFNINDAVANGTTRKQDFLNQWGLNRVQQARMGDIIKVCNAEGKISFARDSKVYQLKKENFPNIDQAIFFQMTPAGFVPLHVNQLKTRPADVPQNATDAELDAAFPKTLNLRDNIIAECFAGRPDVSKPGKTKAVVRAIEKLYDGKYAKFDYEVELNVVPAGELTVKPGQYVLGERWGMQSIERMFTQAQQRDGTPVLWGDKQLYPLKAPDVEKHLQPGTQRIDELFKDAAAPIQFDSKTGHLTARPTATANYGDAIILKGYELRSGRDAGGAFALIHDDGLKVVATAGGSKDNQPIHNRFPSEPYLGITHVPMKDEKVKNLSEVAVKWASGDLGKQDFLNLWGKDRVQSVQAGDIIKVVNVERKIRYTHDSQEQPLNDLANKNELYFEITDQGYQLLRVNQLVPQKANIPINASAAEMDLRLSQFFKLSDKSTYKIKGFKKRPDVSKLGDTTATVTVSQKYGKDKTIEADYDVPVAVVKRATFSTQSQTLKLGEVVTTDTLGNMLKDALEYDDRRIQWGDKALSVTMPDKLAKLLRKDTKRLTKISKPIDVTMKFEASTGTVLSTSPVLTDYGDALVFNGYELFTRNAGGALALVKEGNDWLIVATDGAEDDNRNVHDVFAGEPYLSVSLYEAAGDVLNLQDPKQQVTSMAAQGDTPKQQFLDQWGDKRVVKAKLGDVVVVNHREDKVSVAHAGKREPLKKRANKRESLFEVTASGYKFLTLNQVSFKSLTIENNSDPQTIREAVTNTVKKQQPHLKVENIKFPDLKTVGHKTLTVTVSQPSLTDANKHISYDYQIPLEVTEGTLSFTQAPAALNFGTVKIDGQTLEVPRIGDTPMTIRIKDGRSQKKPWQLLIQQSQPFTDRHQHELKQELLFFRQDGHDYPIKLKQDQQVKAVASQTIQHTFTYDTQAGVLLKIPPNDFDFTTGTYNFGLQWTLSDTPL